MVEIRIVCNSGFSADGKYLALFLRCVLVGYTDPEWRNDEKLARALARHEKLCGRIERSKMDIGPSAAEHAVSGSPNMSGNRLWHQ